MFQTNQPVLGADFHDRSTEMDRLVGLARALVAGSPQWLALIGPRKVGKTSMILELSRRVSELAFVMVDVHELTAPSAEIFRTAALRVADALLAGELTSSLEVAATAGGEFDASLDASASFAALPLGIKTSLRALARTRMSPAFARLCIDLPERLAEALDRKLVIAIDEFQELALGKGHTDLLPMVRATWQRHRRISYIVSGSGRTLLENMVTQYHSPFFQHFSLMYVEPFQREAAVALLAANGAVPVRLAKRAVDVLGGHPFYLQLLGDALTMRPPPYDDSSLKLALQSVLFSATGRLALYLQLGFDRAVGRSSYLAATLDALAEGPARMVDVARTIGAPTADTARYLERLGDLVRKRDDGRYQLEDPVFELWLRWRRRGGTVVPMTVIGDVAEREVAALLAQMGFDLVYQARASRGAFDLLATRGAAQLAVQVKRSELPLSFAAAAWNRMGADARRLGWRWTIAVVDPAGAVSFLDPRKARRGKTVRLTAGAVIDSLAAWIDG